MKQAALGFRVHSGWAAVVALARPARGELAVVDRRRIELVDGDLPKQPYHAAQPLDLTHAAKLVARSIEGARRLALRGLRAVLDTVRAQGYDAAGCGLLLGSGRPVTNLATILASHAQIHSAEGELFREALAHAGEQCGLPVRGVKEKELYAVCAADLDLAASELDRRLMEFGRALGPPWRQDEKYATLAAWLALGSGALGQGNYS